MNTGKTFQEQWIYPSELKKELKAASYDLRPLPENFKSGRGKWECLFFSGDRKLISRRLAMELVSKRTGLPYHVCERERDEPSPRGLAPPAPLRRAPLTVDDVFDDELPPPLPLRRETTADYLP